MFIIIFSHALITSLDSVLTYKYPILHDDYIGDFKIKTSSKNVNLESRIIN